MNKRVKLGLALGVMLAACRQTPSESPPAQGPKADRGSVAKEGDAAGNISPEGSTSTDADAPKGASAGGAADPGSAVTTAGPEVGPSGSGAKAEAVPGWFDRWTTGLRIRLSVLTRGWVRLPPANKTGRAEALKPKKEMTDTEKKNAEVLKQIQEQTKQQMDMIAQQNQMMLQQMQMQRQQQQALQSALQTQQQTRQALDAANQSRQNNR